MSPSRGKREQSNLKIVQYCVCGHLLKKGELLGNVLCAVFIFAEGDSLLAVHGGSGEVVHQGAVARHGQGCGNGKGLLFWQGSRRLHCSWESPLKGPGRK